MKIFDRLMSGFIGGVALVAVAHPGVRADPWPHVLASIWLSPDGEARMGDGRIYRLMDEKGRPVHLGRRLCLTILDARPEGKR